MTQTQARLQRPQGLAAVPRLLSGPPCALVRRLRPRGHAVFDRLLFRRFPGAGERTAQAPTAGCISLGPLLAHAPGSLGALGRSPAHAHQRRPPRGDTRFSHGAQQGRCAAIRGVAWGPNAPQAHGHARPIPGSSNRTTRSPTNQGCCWLLRPCCAPGCWRPRVSARRPSPHRDSPPWVGGGQGATRACTHQLPSRGTCQEAALSRRPKRHAVLAAGVHLALSAKVVRPGCTACMQTSQPRRRRWRPRHTVGMPRNTLVTQPGREVKAIIMRSALSRGIQGKKRTMAIPTAPLYLAALICKGFTV